jgi:plasmid stabilization system protein ParE
MPEHHTVTIIWSVAALRDIQRLRSFVEPQNKEAAKRAAEAIKKAASTLMTHPLLGKRLEARQDHEIFIPFGQRGYVMRYRLDGDTVVILRIWHGREEK